MHYSSFAAGFMLSSAMWNAVRAKWGWATVFTAFTAVAVLDACFG